jgi:hypothetical protein
MLVAACKRTLSDEEIFGPQYKPAPEGFAITSAFSANVATADFYSLPLTPVTFAATFSHEVSWTITITGQQSGAVKVITGLSNIINASNSVWDGGSSNNYFFIAGENATAVLTILGSTLTQNDVINILAAKRYANQTFNGVKYTVIDDFERPTGQASTFRWLDGAYKDLGDGTVISSKSTTIKMQGLQSHRFAGTDVNSNSWLAGINTEPINSDTGYATTDPSAYYVNLYVYGTGKANTSIQIKAYEMDDWSQLSATYDQANNDGYVYDIFVDWTGWKLVSARYADFKRSNDPAAGGNGNGIKEPNKIVGFSLGLNSQPTFGKEVEAYVDFMVVSEGGVFKP